MSFEALIPQLRELLKPGPERVGFILQNLEIVEVENVCDDPENGFEVKGEDLVARQADAIATWHTHPAANSHLSPNDRDGFRSYPNWTHLIIGEDGVRAYRVTAGRVLNDQAWVDEG